MPAEKIMIVDDERLVRWSLRQKCEEWGYLVIEADAGEPALRLAQQESPDLVLLDVRMPDLTGIEVLDQLKKNGDARAVIMITADPQLDDVKAALKLGAYDFVGKPIDFDSCAWPSRTRWKRPACATKSRRCVARCGARWAMTAW
jgi:DNA-binding NtrC family response regulator